MSIRHHAGAIRQALLCSVNRRTARLGQAGNVVSFTFDDFPRSAYTIAGPIMKTYRVRATYYVAAGLAGAINHLGPHFEEEDLKSLENDGHEIGTHTFGHVSGRTLQTSKFVSNVKEGISHLSALRLQSSLSAFAYPFGDVTTSLKKRVGAVVGSARGIVPGLNGPAVDLNLLRANPVYGGMESFDQIRKLIAENARKRAWLIFYTHDVRPEPSKFGCSPELFEAVLSCVISSGFAVRTISEVVRDLALPSSSVA